MSTTSTIIPLWLIVREWLKPILNQYGATIYMMDTDSFAKPTLKSRTVYIDFRSIVKEFTLSDRKMKVYDQNIAILHGDYKTTILHATSPTFFDDLKRYLEPALIRLKKRNDKIRNRIKKN